MELILFNFKRILILKLRIFILAFCIDYNNTTVSCFVIQVSFLCYYNYDIYLNSYIANDVNVISNQLSKSIVKLIVRKVH